MIEYCHTENCSFPVLIVKYWNLKKPSWWILQNCQIYSKEMLVNNINRIIMRPSSLRRGPHIASHSVYLSVCLSVSPSIPLLFLFTFFTVEPSYERTSKIEKLLFCLWASVTYVLFGTHRGPHIVRPSRPHKLVVLSVVSRHICAVTCDLQTAYQDICIYWIIPGHSHLTRYSSVDLAIINII